jgi:putative ABC transport system permease protein
MNLWFDLKYAWRLFTKSRGHSLLCAGVVALSVGLAVWAFWLGYVQLWKPLPFPDSDRWYSVQLAADSAATARPLVDAYTWQEVLKSSPSAEYLGAFVSRRSVLGEGQASTSLRGAAMTPRLFAATKVAPQLGRVFTDSDGQPGAAAVAILSHETWRNYFAADPNVIGRTARIDAAPVQIVGVMPKDFFSFDDFELWLPLHMTQLARPVDSTVMLSPIVLVQDGQSADSVVKEMQTVVARVNADHPELFKPTRHVQLIPAMRMFNHGSTPIVAVIGFMAAAVLLLGCVNISMVFLARLLERSRELALRTALGSSRPRLLRQCLLETGFIVALGLVAGFGLAALGVRWARSIGDLMARVMASGGDGGMLTLRPIDFLVATVAAVTVWLLSTLIPAWRVSRRDAATVLASSGKGAAAQGSSKSVAMLVGLQVVISCLVLVLCGNLVVSISRELGKPTGIDSERVVLTTAATEFGPRHAEPEQRLRYWDELSAAIRSRVPGAEVAYVTASPTRPVRVSATIESQQGTQKEGTLTLPLSVVSENYFGLLGLKRRMGRGFDITDNGNSLDVAVVDEQMAARYWPDGDVLGKRVRLNTENGRWLTIVGVVSGVTGRPYRNEEIGVLYRPLRQAVPAQFQLLVKLPNAATDSRPALRAAAFAVDRDLPLHNLQTLDDYVRALNISWTAIVPVVIVIALITALLAASGLFGLISRAVAQRTQEVGIRRALGATTWRATSMFRRQGVLYLSVSLVGAALGVMVTTLMSSVFPNILEKVIPVTLGVFFLMAAVVFTASYLPTRRAVALEPGDALRYE